jgi:hypothetical protein
VKLLAALGGSVFVLLVVTGSSALIFGWLYTVLFPDESRSATDLYAFAVVGAAVVGAIVGLVITVTFFALLGRRLRLAP